MKFFFYNESNYLKIDNGHQFNPKNDVAGLKILLDNNYIGKSIYIILDLDIGLDSFLVFFDNQDKIIPVYNLPREKNYKQNIKKIVPNNIKYVGIIYKKGNIDSNVIIRKFTLYLNKPLLLNRPINSNCFFDRIYFINLPHRRERRQHIENELHKVGLDFSKITPISAFNYPLQPQIGCAISHMKALKDAYLNKYNKILILEDDFTFNLKNKPINFYLNKLEKYLPNWDVIQFSTVNSSTIDTNINGIKKVIKSDTTAGYGLKKDMIIYLFNIFKTCLLPDKNIKGNKFAIDVLWQSIQKDFNWYIYDPNIGYQNEKFISDIEQYRSISWTL